ncbi:MAG: hypothetical protein HKN43_01675 [Rhodothermales bacterium]|nr:hypothetical protein [Rhodothermales bacterium]
MHKDLRTNLSLFCTLLLVAIVTAWSTAPVYAQKQNSPSSLLSYKAQVTNPGDGYMVAGELWETIKPLNSVEDNNVEDPLGPSLDALHFLTLGPDGGNWFEPGGHWPGGYDLVNTWRDGRRLVFPAFEADGWGPALQGGAATDGRFAFAYYTPTVAGAGDPARDYKRDAQFTDASRTHLVYEAGFPTNIGVDFKIRAHQYSINEQNLNDFVALEISMTNTGEVDIDADGTVEMTGHDLDAIASAAWVEPTIAVRVTQTAGRSNRFGAGRTVGYAGATNSSGEPHDLFYWFPNTPEDRYAAGATPAAGARRFGVNDGRINEGYTDVWLAHRYMGAKQGAIVDGDIHAIGAGSPDKLTLFGTHPVGMGAQRGWYSSMQWENSLFGFNESEQAFRSATATWYEDYGKNTTDFATADLNPNSNFFSGGTADDVTTFVVGDPGARPNGDIKYAAQDLANGAGGRGQQAPVWEDELRGGSSDFYDVIGHTLTHTFGQDPSIGNGPYGLAVGESMTLVFVSVGGFRFEGVRDASEAADWAWEQNWDVASVFAAPPTPDLKVESTQDGTALLRWTDVSGIDGDIDGYKIWRAAQFQRSNWLEGGFRVVDNYHQQHTVGDRPTSVFDAVNPNFDAAAEFTGDVQGTYQPSEWGPYSLVLKIPLSEVSQYNNAGGGYDFAFEDTDAITGFTYWYYISAYKEGSFTGPQGAVSAGHIESSNWNRNGRNAPDAADGEISLNTPWSGTYGFAIRNAEYPAPGTQGEKNIGGPFTVTPPVAAVSDVESLITVTPNPYKITGLNDVRSNASSHAINFLNLPADYKLTILDTAGQIIFETSVDGAPDGRFTWDLFSKDGVEIASGLYIYHLEYDAGAVTGHFAILR